MSIELPPRPTTPDSATAETTTGGPTTTVDPNAAPCPASSLTVPGDFTGPSGDVAAGQNAVYTCSDATKVYILPQRFPQEDFQLHI